MKENFPEDAGHEKKETEDSRCGAHPPGGRVHVHLRIFFTFLGLGLDLKVCVCELGPHLTTV